MNSITIDNISYTAPSSWNEVDMDQLMTWQKICRKKLSGESALRLATICFYRIKPKLFFRLNPAQQIQLIDTLTFLGESNSLTNWIVPDLKIWFRKYSGPANRLTSSTVKEFRRLEIYYAIYQQKKDEKVLDMLIATLYREKGESDTDDDPRIALTGTGILNRAKRMSGLSQPLRKAILFNYSGCREFILKKYPTIFPPKSPSKNNGVPDIVGLMKTVAGGKFGSFSETVNTPLYLFLDHLADEIKAVEELKSKRP